MHIALMRRGYSGSGGAERYLLRLATGLLQRGHKVSLLVDQPWPKTILAEDLDQLIFPSSSPIQFANQVQTHLQTTHYDEQLSLERLWNCAWYRAGDGVHASWLQRRKQFEPNWKHWGRFFNKKHKQILALERSLAQKSSCKILCNSHFVAQEWQKEYGVTTTRTHVVQNGFDPQQQWLRQDRSLLRKQLATTINLNCDLPWILFTGSGFERKGLSTLLAALAQLEKPIELLVAGKGRPLARHFTNGTKVHWLGARTDIPLLSCSADLFCLPTWYDPFSNATLEAAAYGCPVITTNANGFSEAMQAGVHGEIITAGDTQALVNALHLWTDLHRTTQARIACQQNASRLSVAKNVTATLDCLLASS